MSTCLLTPGNWYCSPRQENGRVFYAENLPPPLQPHGKQGASSNAHLRWLLCLFSRAARPSPFHHPQARTAPRTLFDFSNSNCISAKQGFQAPVSTTTPVGIKLNPMFPDNRDSASTPHDHLRNYVHLPPNRLCATIKKKVKRIFFFRL